MVDNILLCSDLDRTILPNGFQEESRKARPLLRVLAAHPRVTLVYVSGRHQGLLRQAIQEFDIPTPDYAIGDVGTTIYEIIEGKWQLNMVWHQEIVRNWHGKTNEMLIKMFDDLKDLKLQEAEKQHRFKLSYYLSMEADCDALLRVMRRRLDSTNIYANIVWSIDEPRNLGLLDLLPQGVGKLSALRFLMKMTGFCEKRTIFAGDSGNDLDVLVSGLQSVLVKNAGHNVRQEAIARACQAAISDKLYIAQGGFLGMNGNYAAGVLEGLVHFIPETKKWLCVKTEVRD